MNPNTLPALPTPLSANVPWPTFSISQAERQAINNGKLPQVKLGTTGAMSATVVLAPAMKQPPVSPAWPTPSTSPTAPSPLASGSQRPIRSYAPGRTRPMTILPPPQAMGSTSPTAPSPLASGSQRPIRSYAPKKVTPPASLPSIPPTSIPVPTYTPAYSPIPKRTTTLFKSTPAWQRLAKWLQSRSADQLGTISLILGCLSFLLFIFASIPAVVFGIIALRKKGTRSKAKATAGLGIAIAVIINLIQILLILPHL